MAHAQRVDPVISRLGRVLGARQWQRDLEKRRAEVEIELASIGCRLCAAANPGEFYVMHNEGNGLIIEEAVTIDQIYNALRLPWHKG